MPILVLRCDAASPARCNQNQIWDLDFLTRSSTTFANLTIAATFAQGAKVFPEVLDISNSMIKYSLWTFNCSTSPLAAVQLIDCRFCGTTPNFRERELKYQVKKSRKITDGFYIYKLFIYYNSSNWWYWGSLMYRCWPIMINNPKQMLICVIVVENLFTFWPFDQPNLAHVMRNMVRVWGKSHEWRRMLQSHFLNSFLCLLEVAPSDFLICTVLIF